MTAHNSLPASQPLAPDSEARLLLVLWDGGTPGQREETLASLRLSGHSWLEFRAYPAGGDVSPLLPLPCDSNGSPDWQACSADYVMFLSPGDILLPEFYDDVPELLRGEPQIVKLASFANAERTWFRSIPKSKVVASWMPDLSPWCKLFPVSLLEPFRCHGGSPLMLHSMARQLVLKYPDSRDCSMPQLIHPHETPLLSPDRLGWRRLRSYMREAVAYASRYPQAACSPEGEPEQYSILLVMFREAWRMREQLTPALRGLFAGWMRLQCVLIGLASGCKRKWVKQAWKTARREAGNEVREKRKEGAMSCSVAARGEELRRKPVINVLFLAISPSIWKVDSVMQAMLAHPRFNPRVLVVPEMQIKSPETRRRQMEQTLRYMEERGYPAFTLCDEDGNGDNVRLPDEADLFFYPKPYPNIVPATLDYPLYPEKLLVSIYYGFHDTCNPHFYEQLSQRIGWIDCYESERSAELARQFKTRQGIRDNAVVTGLPFVDNFLYPAEPLVSPWKPQEGNPKKVIWAPHWTILPDFMHLSHFLEIAEEMKELAMRTVGRVQWAFKPHPLLYDSLCIHPDWGRERTDSYYAWWAETSNTQLETGDYVTLFMHSDAMVHDSCSFCNDYHLSGNPVLFLARDLRTHLAEASPMTREAIMAQYIGKGMEDVERFIHETVLGGQDPLLPQRTAFREQNLIPPHGRTAAENLIDYILTGKTLAR